MTRLEDRLRRDLQAQAEHITPLSVPPLRLERWVTRRRLALRSAAVVTAALTAGAAALAVVGVPGAGHGGTGRPVVDTAYVVKRVDSALSGAGPGEIAQMTVITRGALVPGGTITAEEWSYDGQWHSVIYSSAGHLAYEEGFSTSSLYTLVSYPARTWARGPGLGPPAALLPDTHGCGSPLPASVARALRAAVSCVNLRMAGRQGRGHRADRPRQQDLRDHLGQPGHVPAGARGDPPGPRQASPLAGSRHHLAPADRAEPGQAHRTHPRRIPPGPAHPAHWAGLEVSRRAAAHVQVRSADARHEPQKRGTFCHGHHERPCSTGPPGPITKTLEGDQCTTAPIQRGWRARGERTCSPSHCHS